MRRDAGKVHVVDAGGEVERQIFAGDEEVLVVDGKRGRVSLVLRGSEERKAQKCDEKFVHGRSPFISRQGGVAGFPCLTRLFAPQRKNESGKGTCVGRRTFARETSGTEVIEGNREGKLR